MGLLQLPSELLGIIIQHTLPYSFEALVLTCKELHDSTKPYLARHNELRKKYRSFSFQTSSLSNVPELLVEIAAEPIIADYMVDVNLDYHSLPDEDEISDASIEEFSNKLAPLVLGSPHLRILGCDDEGVDALWLRRIAERKLVNDADDNPSDFGIPFLASLLTNVDSLTVPDKWCSPSIFVEPDISHPIRSFMQLLVARANDKTLNNQALQRLRVIKPSCDLDEQSGAIMELLFPFLALDSLREFHHKCGSCYSFDRENRLFGALGRNLEVMKLDDYVIFAGAARFLFKDMQKLRVLELEYSMKDEIGYSFDANGFIHFLVNGTHKNLEKLVLKGKQVWSDTLKLETSLRGFERLKHLELDTVFLTNGPGAMGFGFGESDTEAEQTECSDEDGEENEDGESEDGENEDGENEDGESEDGENEDGENEDGENENDEYEDEEENSNGEAKDTASDHEDRASVRDDKSDDEDDDIEVLPEGIMSVIDGDGYENIFIGSLHPEDYQMKYTNGTTIFRAISALPESLETLIVHTPAAPRNSAMVERMFWYFEEMREERLPNLKTIEVHVRWHSCWYADLPGSEEQVQRLREFFADKKILTRFKA